MSKKLYITLTFLLSGVLILIWYSSLGGFTDPKIERVDKRAVQLVGKSYKGLSTSKEIGVLMDDIRKHIKEKSLEGDLIVVYFGNPDQEEPIEVFVGAEGSTSTIPPINGFYNKTIEAGKVARATINSYSVVAPNPNKVNEMLKKSLEGSNLKPSGIYMERYISKKEIWTEVYLTEVL
ncbi:MAG: hypothetical protein ACJAWV_001950 [Flammeovirgaceae bacterium]|jgi:hypothetical protein